MNGFDFCGLTLVSGLHVSEFRSSLQMVQHPYLKPRSPQADFADIEFQVIVVAPCDLDGNCKFTGAWRRI